MAQLGVAVAGFDHWYAAIGACDDAARDGRCRVLAVAHADRVHLDPFARERGIPHVLSDPLEAVGLPGVDLVVCAASSDLNPRLLTEAAQRGKAILSVKPMAVTVAAAEAAAATVQRSGVPFFPLESQLRLSQWGQQVRQWWGQGQRLGRPLSALVVMRGSVPRQDWPGHTVQRTWWLDPMRVPGGGWIDHAIYEVDLLRWALGSEVDTVFGRTSSAKHPELAVEDYGVATLTFTNGVVAALEVTWHGTAGAAAHTRQFVGDGGQLVAGRPGEGGWLVAEEREAKGWMQVASPAGGRSPLAHMVDHLTEGTPLAAGIADALANLRACVAFYRAAAEGRAVSPADV